MGVFGNRKRFHSAQCWFLFHHNKRVKAFKKKKKKEKLLYFLCIEEWLLNLIKERCFLFICSGSAEAGQHMVTV